MAERSVVGIYDTMARAEEAVHMLDQAGFPVKHVSIVTQNLASDKTMHGYIMPGDDLTARGVATGIPAGGKREHSFLPNDAYNAAATSGVGELVIAAGVSFKRLPIRLRMKSAAAP